jgi:septal ring factor EnvC (AmiA/AmiB activator)
MTLLPSRLLLCSFLAWTACVQAETTLNDTRGTLERWVETRQLISKTRGDWQSDREMLEQTIQLFERELRGVEEQMAKLGTNGTQVERERLTADAQLKSSNECLDQARQFVTKFEAQIAKQTSRLPVPLQEILKPLLSRMPADPGNTRMSPTERVQVVVGILNELDKFNNSVVISSEKIKNQKGEEVAVETVYVGLGAAYFVNDAGDFAGLGAPGANGWEWTIKPELAAPVREVVRIYRNEHPARFVALPVVIR